MCGRAGAAVAAALALSYGPARAAEAAVRPAAMLAVGGGIAIFKDGHEGNGALALTSGRAWHGIHPGVAAGFAAHARFISLSGSRTWKLSPRLEVSLSTGPGLYKRGGAAPNLGSPIEFLSTVAISCRTTGQQRVALLVGHISNANLAPYNPGSNIVQVLYEFPLRR